MANSKKFDKEFNSKEDSKSKAMNHKSKTRTRKITRDKGDSSKPQDTSKFAGVTTNDPSWYVNNPVLSRDVANIIFSRPTGAPLYPNLLGVYKFGQKDPGIMVLKTMLSWGGSSSTGGEGSGSIWESVAGSPMNLTATKLYQYVVHANSRNVSYDKKDLLMTMMAIDGVWQSLADAIRAYRLIAQYDVTNMYMSSLLEALGWNADDLKSHVAEFRYYINYAITRINKFFVPDLFDMWKAHVAAYTNIYLDQPTPKAQYIAKVPLGFWLYDDAHGCLEYYKEYHFANQAPGVNTDYSHTPGSMTVETFRKMVDLQISQIEDSQYIGIIQGDLLKAFGFEHMAKFNYIDIDMPIYPVYDGEFIFKFHNASWMSDYSTHTVDDSKAVAIYRDTDIVDGNIEMLMTDSGNSSVKTFGSIYIDLPDGMESDPAKVILMSLHKIAKPIANTTRWRLDDGTSGTYIMRDMMPETIYDVFVFINPNDFSSSHVWNVKDTLTLKNNGNSAQFIDPMAFLWAFKAFKHAPAIMLDLVETDDSLAAQVPYWEIDNLAEVSITQLHRINTIVLWSLWSSSLISSTTGV